MDDIKPGQMSFPALTTIQQPYKEICTRAVDLLIERISQPDLPIQRLVLSPRLIIRDSVRRIG